MIFQYFRRKADKPKCINMKLKIKRETLLKSRKKNTELHRAWSPAHFLPHVFAILQRSMLVNHPRRVTPLLDSMVENVGEPG